MADEKIYTRTQTGKQQNASFGETVYEELQNFNFIVRYLHQFRYKSLEKLVASLNDELPDTMNVVDIGCGPAKAYEIIKRKREGRNLHYTGIELSQYFCELAMTRYGEEGSFNIINDLIENQLDTLADADLIIGLESFEHIPESSVVRIIEAIGKSSFKYLYITVPNEIGPAILIKNVGSYLMGYNRYKEYKWAETVYASIYNLDKVARHTNGHKGFDWRWLAATLRQNVKITKKITIPLPIIPKFISPSIGFLCTRQPNDYV